VPIPCLSSAGARNAESSAPPSVASSPHNSPPHHCPGSSPGANSQAPEFSNFTPCVGHPPVRRIGRGFVFEPHCPFAPRLGPAPEQPRIGCISVWVRIDAWRFGLRREGLCPPRRFGSSRGSANGVSVGAGASVQSGVALRLPRALHRGRRSIPDPSPSVHRKGLFGIRSDSLSAHGAPTTGFH